MARLNGILSNLSGTIGDLTFSRQGGVTVAKQKPGKRTGKCTDAQMRHQVKWANVVNLYKTFGNKLHPSFENKLKTVSDFNEFISANVSLVPVYITKQESQNGACLVAPYQVSRGSLPTIVVSKQGNIASTDISLGSLTISDNTTLKAFSDAVVTNNEDYQNGDQITCFIARQLVNQESQIPYVRMKSYCVTLDQTDDTTKLRTLVPADGFNANNGKLGASAAVDGAIVWIHSRRGNGGNGSAGNSTKVSTQRFVVTNSHLAAYQTEAKYQAAALSYGGVKDAEYLTPDADNSTPAADATVTPSTTSYTLSVSANNSSYGSVSGGGTYTAGSNATVTATANSGYKFSQWNDGVSTNPRVVTVNGNMSLSATFETDGGSQGGGDVIGG